MAEQRSVPRTLNLGARERLSAAAAVLGTYAVARRRPRLAALALAGEVALNRDLYRNLANARGLRGVALGIPLHTLHQLIGVVAVPCGLSAHLLERAR